MMNISKAVIIFLAFFMNKIYKLQQHTTFTSNLKSEDVRTLNFILPKVNTNYIRLVQVMIIDNLRLIKLLTKILMKT